MGNIEFIGNMENFTLGQVDIPQNAKIIEGIDSLSPINWIIFGFPIILLLLIPMIYKQKKYGILNKEIRKKWSDENIKKYKLYDSKKRLKFVYKNFIKIFSIVMIGSLLIGTLVHEFLHAFVGFLFGADMKVGYISICGIWCALTESPMTKIQCLCYVLTPILLLGIIPAIIVLLNYPTKIKNHLKAWVLFLLLISIVSTAFPDIVATYNICKNVPHNAIIINDDNNSYLYIPDN
jgi:hypothetical protein